MNRKKIVLGIIIIGCAFGLLLPVSAAKTSTQKNKIELTVDPDDTASIQPAYSSGALVYYPTMEEAIAKTDTDMFDEYPGSRNIDTKVQSFESDDTALLFYAGNEKDGYFVAARFEKRITEDNTEYALTNISPSEISKGGLGTIKDPQENVRNSIEASAMCNMLGYTTADADERFVWGISMLEDVNHMKIDGQKPDAVISYEQSGTTWYFWYYENLKSDAAISDLKIEFV